jgi:phosphoribosylamine-glycine ligase
MYAAVAAEPTCVYTDAGRATEVVAAQEQLESARDKAIEILRIDVSSFNFCLFYQICF